MPLPKTSWLKRLTVKQSIDIKWLQTDWHKSWIALVTMGKRILAVDDNPAILDVLNEILSFEGYEVVTVSDGKSVFDMIQKVHPDLILLDVMLNHLDGREICRALKNNSEFSGIPVIMISASHDLRSSLNQPGAPDDFIAKPFDIYYLISKVNNQLAA